jgi:hypothetical protein
MSAQEYDKYSILGILSVVVVFMLPVPAFSAADRSDPILAGPAPGPCAEQASGADYVSGTDATGNPVTPAEGPGTTPQLGDGTVLLSVPRHHGGDVSVPVKLSELSPPSCTPAQPAPPPSRR